MANNLPSVPNSGLPSRNSSPPALRTSSHDDGIIDVNATTIRERRPARSYSLPNVVISFFLIVVLASLLIVPGFIDSLEVFLPTEKKIYDENGVIHYEVESEWKTEDVMTVGQNAMNVFKTFGSFIGNLGSAADLAFSLFSSTVDFFLGTSSTGVVVSGLLDIPHAFPASVMPDEFEFWCLYTTLDEMYLAKDDLFSVGVPKSFGLIDTLTPASNIIYFVSTDYLTRYSSRVSWWDRNVVVPLHNLFNDYTKVDYVYFVSPSDFLEVKRLIAEYNQSN